MPYCFGSKEAGEFLLSLRECARADSSALISRINMLIMTRDDEMNRQSVHQELSSMFSIYNPSSVHCQVMS